MESETRCSLRAKVKIDPSKYRKAVLNAASKTRTPIMVKKATGPKDNDSLSPVKSDSPIPTWIQPRRLDVTLKHNQFCDMCIASHKLSPHVHCVYCNIMVHEECMQKYQKNFKAVPDWICYHCVDYLDDSRRVFDAYMVEKANIGATQVKIASLWRMYSARKHYIMVYNIIVKIQVFFRIRQRRRNFVNRRQEKLRPMKVFITSIENLTSVDHSFRTTSNKMPTKFYVLVTVLDYYSGMSNQYWKLESNLVQGKEGSLQKKLQFDFSAVLAGVSGLQLIILSVFQIGKSRDFFLGQAAVDISKDFIWRKGGSFSENLSDQSYVIKDSQNQDYKADYSVNPSGLIHFHIVTSKGVQGECGGLHATAIDDLTRDLYNLPMGPGYEMYFGPNKGGGPAKKGGGIWGANTMMHSVTDALPQKRMFGAIFEGKLYCYHHLGDNLKLILHLEHFEHTIRTIPNTRTLQYCLTCKGYPTFTFSTLNKTESLRWKCAFVSSMQSVKNILSDTPNDATDMAAWICELVRVGGTKPKKVFESRREHSPVEKIVSKKDTAEKKEYFHADDYSVESIDHLKDGKHKTAPEYHGPNRRRRGAIEHYEHEKEQKEHRRRHGQGHSLINSHGHNHGSRGSSRNASKTGKRPAMLTIEEAEKEKAVALPPIAGSSSLTSVNQVVRKTRASTSSVPCSMPVIPTPLKPQFHTGSIRKKHHHQHHHRSKHRHHSKNGGIETPSFCSMLDDMFKKAGVDELINGSAREISDRAEKEHQEKASMRKNVKKRGSKTALKTDTDEVSEYSSSDDAKEVGSESENSAEYDIDNENDDIKSWNSYDSQEDTGSRDGRSVASENTTSNNLGDLEQGIKELLLFDDEALATDYGETAAMLAKAVELEVANHKHHHT